MWFLHLGIGVRSIDRGGHLNSCTNEYRLVYVIGTNHAIQRGHPSIEQADIEEFRNEIDSNILKHGIQFAFEEMHETEVYGDETVCQNVCSSLGVPVRFVDLSRKERKCLAIDPWLLEDAIDRALATPGDGLIEREELEKAPEVLPFTTHIIAPVRERVWVARIRKEDT